MRWMVVSLSLTVLVSCTAVQQGPPVELADFHVPTVVREAEKAKATAPPLPPPQVVPQGTIKAWTPRTVAPNGDSHEGHYVSVSRTPPKDERTPPPYVIPTAPKVLHRPQPKKPPAPLPVESRPSPPMLPEYGPSLPEMRPAPPERLPLPLPQEGPYAVPVP